MSAIALGTGNFGTGWGQGADVDTSRTILDAYTEAGGNVIDAAEIYQFGQPETLLAISRSSHACAFWCKSLVDKIIQRLAN